MAIPKLKKKKKRELLTKALTKWVSMSDKLAFRRVSLISLKLLHPDPTFSQVFTVFFVYTVGYYDYLRFRLEINFTNSQMWSWHLCLQKYFQIFFPSGFQELGYFNLLVNFCLPVFAHLHMDGFVFIDQLAWLLQKSKVQCLLIL